MSGPIRASSVQDGLKHKFAIWSLAIFGSLSGSGDLRLNHASLWAADDLAATAIKTDTPAATPRGRASNDAFTAHELASLLKAKKLDEAKQRVDAALASNPGPESDSLSFTLAIELLHKEPAAARERLASIVQRLAENLDEASPRLGLSVLRNSVRTLIDSLSKTGEFESALDVAERTLGSMERMGPNALSAADSLRLQRCALLVKAGRADEARALLESRIEASLTKPPVDTQALYVYADLFAKEFPEQVNDHRARTEQLLSDRLSKDDATLQDYVSYQTFQLNRVAHESQSDLAAANARLAELEARAERFVDNVSENELKSFAAARQTLRAARARFASMLFHESLIGRPAPEFDIASTVEMPKVSWADLKDKVVLIDFWAVWSEPCIAAFPHLQHLQQEFADRGLVIIGVTRQYGYQWDDEAQRPTAKKDASLDEEVAMLAEFRNSYKLDYGFVVTPPRSEFSKKFGVAGIPQAVVVDQNGVIQLIRVGSGEESFAQIEAKIRELLAKS